MKLNPKYVNEDDENYFDFQRYNNDFKKQNYKKISALIPRSDTEMIEYLKTKFSEGRKSYPLKT